MEQGVFAHMHLVIACVSTHEEHFRAAMGAKQKVEVKRELTTKQWQLAQSERRVIELYRLFKRIYEDNANGKLSDSRFQMLSNDYEQEEQSESIGRFIGKVRKYLDLDELMHPILNDMVKTVYVHTPAKSSEHREQQIDISYDFVGIIPASLLYDLSNGETAYPMLRRFPKTFLCYFMSAALTADPFFINCYNFSKATIYSLSSGR